MPTQACPATPYISTLYHLCLRTLGSRHNEVLADYQDFTRKTKRVRAIGKKELEWQ